MLTAAAACNSQAAPAVAAPATVVAGDTAHVASAQSGATMNEYGGGLDIQIIASTWHPDVTVPGDANRDGRVNVLDIALVRTHWLDKSGIGDINLDGNVNALDLAIIKSHWLQSDAGVPGSAGVPATATSSNSSVEISTPALGAVDTAQSSGAMTSVATGGIAPAVDVSAPDSHVDLPRSSASPTTDTAQPTGQSDSAIGTGGLIVRIPQLLPITLVYPVLAGDANRDNTVNALDIAAVEAHWLQATDLGDSNNDGRVDALDLAAIKSHWLQHQDGRNGIAVVGASAGVASGRPSANS